MCAYHIVWLLWSKMGRRERQALWFRKRDAQEAGALLAYNTGLRHRKPSWSGKFNYIEKMEYWALIWGAGIMTATGFLLTFENFTLHYFPKWIVDLASTIHFYEALLAILAIVVWHLYWTVFDLHVYPMNWAWLTGFVKRQQKGKSKEHE